MVAGTIEGSSINFLLVTGAPTKVRRLEHVAQQVPESTLSKVGAVGIVVRSESCPVPIVELNAVKSAPTLYWQKAEDTRQVMADRLQEGEWGVTADTHPKIGRQQEQLRTVLTKHPRGPELLTLSDRKTALSEAIAAHFGPLGTGETLVRNGAGVVLWNQRQVVGLNDKKIYLVFERNPLSSIEAARDYLDMAAEVHTDLHGVPNNIELERSVNVPCGVTQEDLILFALIQGIKVEMRGRTNDPIAEVDALGDGFSGQVLLAMLQLIAPRDVDLGLREQPNTWVTPKRIRMLPQHRHEIIFSQNDNRPISRYLGSYEMI